MSKKEDLKRVRLKILSGSTHPKLAKQIDEELGGGFRINVSVSEFKDGETCVTIDGDTVRRSRVLIVHSARPHKMDRDLMELYQLVQAANRASALEVNVLLTYFPYARQDRKDKPRRPISAKLVIKMLEILGVRSLTCFDLHSPQIQGFSWLMPINYLWPDKIFTPYIKEHFHLDNTVLLSPDSGARKRAKRVSDQLPQKNGSRDLPVANKVRDREGKPHVKSITGAESLKHQDLVIIDDIANTCSSLDEVAKKASEFSPNSIRAICSHGLFVDGAIEKLKKSPIEEVVVTDSVPEVPDDEPMIETLPLAPSLSKVVEKEFLGQSVSEAWYHT